jgi:hypothetical protein
MTLDNKLANWGINDGREHNLTATIAIIRIPKRKPEVVFGQIHDQSDDLIELRVSGTPQRGYKLDAFHNNRIYGVMDRNYSLGKKFTYRISARRGIVSVYYNNMNKPSFSFRARNKGCYFKLGNYQVISFIYFNPSNLTPKLKEEIQGYHPKYGYIATKLLTFNSIKSVFIECSSIFSKVLSDTHV